MGLKFPTAVKLRTWLSFKHTALVACQTNISLVQSIKTNNGILKCLVHVTITSQRYFKEKTSKNITGGF